MAPNILIRTGTVPDLALIQKLWSELYEHQREHGLIITVDATGFERWKQSLGVVLGRFGCLFILEKDAEIIGFLAGRLRSPSPPFDPRPVGFISEVYVASDYRRLGYGKKLIQAAQDWFVAEGVVRMELQVLAQNHAARDAYIKLGWSEELVQMTYQIVNSAK